MNILKVPAFTKKSLEKHLSNYAGLGKVLTYKKIEGGVANVVYKIQTTKGNFVLKIVVRNNPHRVKYEIELLNKIKNLPTPKPISTKNKKFLFMYKNHQTVLYPYLPGRGVNNINENMVFQVGKFLGKLHLQTENFSSSIKRIALYEVTLRKLNYVSKVQPSISSEKIRNAISYIKKNSLKYSLPSSLPNGAMHLDINQRNVLFLNRKLTGVVDFDNSYNGPLILDLAGALVWFGYQNNKFNLQKIRKLYEGYVSVRRLNQKEKAELINMFHYYILGIVLHVIEFFIQKKISEKFTIKVAINHLLEAEKKLILIERKLNYIFLK